MYLTPRRWKVRMMLLLVLLLLLLRRLRLTLSPRVQVWSAAIVGAVAAAASALFGADDGATDRDCLGFVAAAVHKDYIRIMQFHAVDPSVNPSIIDGRLCGAQADQRQRGAAGAHAYLARIPAVSALCNLCSC